jgi:hypothetical protein
MLIIWHFICKHAEIVQVRYNLKEYERQIGMYGRLKYCCILATIIALLSVSIAPVYAAVPQYVAGSTGVDISWPKANCRVPTRFLRAWAIVGVNGGLDFTANPCLRAEVARVSTVTLYANTGYPGFAYGQRFATSPRDCHSNSPTCLAYNYGYAAGMYTVEYAASQGIHGTMWWLDVETDNSWTTDPLANRAEIAGEAAAIQHSTVIARIGIYSYPGQWDLITDNWTNGLPNWVATGSLERTVAQAFCRDENFTGGSTWLTQYTVRLDEDYVCQTS